MCSRSTFNLQTPNAKCGEHRTDICNGCRRPTKCHTTCLDSSAATIFVYYYCSYPYYTYTHIGGTDCNIFFLSSSLNNIRNFHNSPEDRKIEEKRDGTHNNYWKRRNPVNNCDNGTVHMLYGTITYLLLSFASWFLAHVEIYSIRCKWKIPYFRVFVEFPILGNLTSIMMLFDMWR